ncbi:MAG: IclR family transcriptional regulator [Burkholderiaceae bacterium]
MQSSIVGKLLTIVTLVSEASKPPSFSELVRTSGLNKSTVHRLLAVAMESQLLQFDAQRKAYLLGPKLFDLVKNAHKGYDIQIIALEEMIRLNKLSGENVTIGVPQGTDIVYLRVLDSPHNMGSVPMPGMREPFHCSASGKALMAFLPDKAIRAKLDGHHFDRYTARTLTDQASFIAALEEIRHTGYATNDREEYDHFVGISAPIFNYLAEPIAALNIWSLHQRCPLDGLRAWADELMHSAARVTTLIGGEPPALKDLLNR